ncbi:unnamed protein product [Phytophthora lilii]|uniref:Unnamed protein product n=1 Tax=Phytophthora lilii TaxID=2077276 RepID=A0A9W6TFH4_9STRA|nr:unnamed protein product [Phytophthora lilii]
MSGFSYPQLIFVSNTYNHSFYLSLDQTGFLAYAYANTLYLSKTDYRLSYISGITPGTASLGTALVVGSDYSLSGIGALSQTLGSVSVTNPLFWSGGSSRNFEWRLIDNKTISTLSYSYGGSYNDQITWNHNLGQPIYTISGFDSMQVINDNSTTMIYMNNSDRCGINITSPEATLHVGGQVCTSSGGFHTKANGIGGYYTFRGSSYSQNVGVGSNSSTTIGIRFGANDSTFTFTAYAPCYGGAYTNASDERLKTDIIDMLKYCSLHETS